MQVEPDEDLDALWLRTREAKSLDYVFLRLGELDPDRASLGAVPEAPQARLEGGEQWWNKHKEDTGKFVRKFVCSSRVIRQQGPLRVLQLVFGALAHPFGGALATYATIIFVEQTFGKTVNDLTKEALEQWCAKRVDATKRNQPKRAKKRIKKKGGS